MLEFFGCEISEILEFFIFLQSCFPSCHYYCYFIISLFSSILLPLTLIFLFRVNLGSCYFTSLVLFYLKFEWEILESSFVILGACYFTSLVLFYLKFEWEILESSFGWFVMGWNEETPDTDDFIETPG